MSAEPHILVIGDDDHAVARALRDADPRARVQAAADCFEAIALLDRVTCSAVLAPAEAIAQRPIEALGALRRRSNDARLVLYGPASSESLCRRMASVACDDYVILPVEARDLAGLVERSRLRLAPAPRQPAPAGDAALGVVEAVLSAMVEKPGASLDEAAARMEAALGPSMRLRLLARGAELPEANGSALHLRRPLQGDDARPREVHLLARGPLDRGEAERLLGQIAACLSHVAAIEDRHRRLQRLALIDDLTGVYNGRYFRHFLRRICERARALRFPVTLLLFDIDNFKQYNDRHGHGVGDEILRQTARLMKRCCRDHDLVARISGDEFAVVFWEKEGPRQPHQPRPATAARLPTDPAVVFDRCRRLLASSEFTALGHAGQGQLTISGGLAVFPYEAGTPEQLMHLADQRLMFGAKRAGKDALMLVGGDQAPPPG